MRRIATGSPRRGVSSSAVSVQRLLPAIFVDRMIRRVGRHLRLEPVEDLVARQEQHRDVARQELVGQRQGLGHIDARGAFRIGRARREPRGGDADAGRARSGRRLPKPSSGAANRATADPAQRAPRRRVVDAIARPRALAARKVAAPISESPPTSRNMTDS